jgi:hypothetical protein
MVTILWDTIKVIHIHFLSCGTATTNYYSSLLKECVRIHSEEAMPIAEKELLFSITIPSHIMSSNNILEEMYWAVF